MRRKVALAFLVAMLAAALPARAHPLAPRDRAMEGSLGFVGIFQLLKQGETDANRWLLVTAHQGGLSRPATGSPTAGSHPGAWFEAVAVFGDPLFADRWRPFWGPLPASGISVSPTGDTATLRIPMGDLGTLALQARALTLMQPFVDLFPYQPMRLWVMFQHAPGAEVHTWNLLTEMVQARRATVTGTLGSYSVVDVRGNHGYPYGFVTGGARQAAYVDKPPPDSWPSHASMPSHGVLVRT